MCGVGPVDLIRSPDAELYENELRIDEEELRTFPEEHDGASR